MLLLSHAGFVFGEAQLDKSVGIFSFARYGTPATVPDFLRRCCMVLTHEVTHLFGVCVPLVPHRSWPGRACTAVLLASYSCRLSANYK